MYTSLGMKLLYPCRILKTLLIIPRHIHWYERMWPMGANGTIDESSIKNNNTYLTNPGVSMAHLVHGMAGNGESHVVLGQGLLGGLTPNVTNPYTAYLDQEHYGFSKLRVINSTAITLSFVQGFDGEINDEVTILKRSSSSNTSTCTATTSTPVTTNSASRMVAFSLTGIVGAMALTISLS
jgi:hypothetical protein